MVFRRACQSNRERYFVEAIQRTVRQIVFARDFLWRCSVSFVDRLESRRPAVRNPLAKLVLRGSSLRLRLPGGFRK